MTKQITEKMQQTRQKRKQSRKTTLLRKRGKKKSGRVDWIRTSGHTPPRRVLYRAELLPVAQLRETLFSALSLKKFAKVLLFFEMTK